MERLQGIQKMASRLFQCVYEKVRTILEFAPGCHDFDHTLRVLNNARAIAKGELGKEDADLFPAVELGAVLHDVARPEELDSGGKICHAEAGAPKAAEILRECGCTDETLIRIVSESVKRHRFRGRNAPLSLIDRIVYDADKLDSIGAVGIGRSFHFAGRVGARLHNTEQEALSGKEYGREDSAYREYLVKLRYVPERMLTETGRAMARERAEFMHEFFRRMNRESGCDQSSSPETGHSFRSRTADGNH